MKRIILPIVLICTSLYGYKQQSKSGSFVLNAFNYFKKAEIIGVTDEKAIAAASPYLSKEMVEALKSANKIEEEYNSQTKDQYPPLSEGWNLFFGVYEGATSFTLISCNVSGYRGIAIIEFTLRDQGSGKPEVWQRKVFLLKESGHWVIDDLQDLPNAKVEPATTLLSQLKEFIKTKGGTIKN